MLTVNRGNYSRSHYSFWSVAAGDIRSKFVSLHDLLKNMREISLNRFVFNMNMILITKVFVGNPLQSMCNVYKILFIHIFNNGYLLKLPSRLNMSIYKGRRNIYTCFYAVDSICMFRTPTQAETLKLTQT